MADAPEKLADKIELEVVTPEREVARETVTEVQVPGRAGYLGVLPGHTPLLSELGIGALSYQKGGQTVYIAIFGGIVEVLSSRVTVLADDAERAEEINVAQANAALAEAEKKLASAAADPNTDWDAVLLSLARAAVRLEVAKHAGAVPAAAEAYH